MATETTADDPKEARTTDAVHKQALERFTLCADAYFDQELREVEDLAFVDEDQQWPDDLIQSRKAQAAVGAMPPVPARPIITVNRLRQPVQQTENQIRSARLTLTFSPKSENASKETAEAFEDIARAIQTDSRAHLARNWAAGRAVRCGRGAYRILTAYANEDNDDLDIIYKRILNQAAVRFDPFAQEPDWSDGEYAFVCEDMAWARYKREFPDSQMATFSDEQLTGLSDSPAGWITGDGESRAIRIAEYFYLEHHDVKRVLCSDGTWHDEDQIPAGLTIALNADGKPLRPARTVDRPTVKWCKLNAIEILSSEDWMGRYIPLIPVIGEEANVNGRRSWRGIVRPGIGSNRSYNYMRAGIIEAVALGTKAPYVGFWETIEPYKQWWAQANTKNFVMLPVAKVMDSQGNVLPPPKREVVEPAVQAMSLAASQALDDVHATTGVPPLALGKQDRHDRTAKGTQLLLAAAAEGSSGYLDNLAHMSMILEGKILKDLIPKVYDRKGRVVPGIGADEQRRQILLGQPFMLQGGKPVPSQEPQAQMIDLAAGEYDVAVVVGTDKGTERQEAASNMFDFAQAAPGLMPQIADLVAAAQDGPGWMQIADRLKKANPLAQEDHAPLPPAAQAQMRQMQERLQKAEMIMGAQQKALDEKRIEQETKIQIEQMDLASKERLAALDRETKLAVAEIEAKEEREKLFLEERARLGVELSNHAHESRQAELQRQHEMAMAEREQAHQEAEKQKDRQLAAAKKVTKTIQRGEDGRPTGIVEESMVSS